jgi:hypothetical protein
VDIDLGSVARFASKLGVHLLLGDTPIVDVGMLVQVYTIHLARDGLQVGSAATGGVSNVQMQTQSAREDIPSGRTKDDEHLSSLKDTINSVQDVDFSFPTRVGEIPQCR